MPLFLHFKTTHFLDKIKQTEHTEIMGKPLSLVLTSANFVGFL